jgi:hypothetical protein
VDESLPVLSNRVAGFDLSILAFTGSGVKARDSAIE